MLPWLLCPHASGINDEFGDCGVWISFSNFENGKQGAAEKAVQGYKVKMFSPFLGPNSTSANMLNEGPARVRKEQMESTAAWHLKYIKMWFHKSQVAYKVVFRETRKRSVCYTRWLNQNIIKWRGKKDIGTPWNDILLNIHIINTCFAQYVALTCYHPMKKNRRYH